MPVLLGVAYREINGKPPGPSPPILRVADDSPIPYAKACKSGNATERCSPKHGFERHVFNQKFNVTLNDRGDGGAEHPLFIGEQQADLAEFEADRGAVAPA